MEITPEIRALLDRLPGAAPESVSSSPSLITRAGKQLANLPSNVAEGFTQSLVNLAEFGNPEGPTTKVDIPDFFNIPKATTTGEGLVDAALGKGGLADIIGQSLIPVGAVGKLGKAIGLAEGPGLEAAKWAAGFAMPEVQREEASVADVGVAATLGAAQGGMSFLPRRHRIIPNLITSGAHGLYEAAVRGPEAGLIAFGADMVGGMLPGAMKTEEGAVTSAGFMETQKPTMPTGPIESAPPTNSRVLREQPPLQNLIQPEVDLSRFAPLQNQERGIQNLIQPEVDLSRFAPKREVPQIVGETKIQAAESKPPVPVVPKEAPAAQMPTAEARVSKTVEEQAFDGTLLKRFTGMSDEELRAIKNDLDNEIANSSDEATRAAYGNTRSAIDTVLSSRGKSTSSVGEVAARAEAKSWKPEDRVVYRDTFGQEQHGTVVGVVGGRAKVKFDGERDTVLLASDTLQASTSPKEIATLQKGKFDTTDGEVPFEALSEEEKLDKLFRSIADDEPENPHIEATALRYKDKFVAGDTIQEHKTLMGKAMEAFADDPDFIGDVEHGYVVTRQGERVFLTRKEAEAAAKAAGQIPSDFKSTAREGMSSQELMDAIKKKAALNSRTGTGVSVNPKTNPDLATSTSTVAMLKQLVKAYKTATNKHLGFRFEELPPGIQGRTFGGKDVELSASWMVNLFENWHTLTALQKREALLEFSRVIGHEAGHVALNLADAENPTLIPALIKEYKALTPETRLKIIGDHYDRMGAKLHPKDIAYLAGDPEIINQAYRLHRWNIPAQDFIGMMEFFAELSSAHLFGKLREDLLPKEMRSLWQKIKDLFSTIIEKFQAVTFGGMEDEVEQQLAFRNFHEILTAVHDNLPQKTAAEINELSRKAVDKTQYRLGQLHEASEVMAQIEAMYDQGLLTHYDLPDLRKRYGKQEWFKKFENKVKNDLEEIATLQNLHSQAENNWPEDFQFMSRTEGRAPSPIVGNRAFIETELVRTLGAAAIGAAVGGVVGPRLTDQQMTVAEGIIAGGILGAAGPTVFRRMIGSMPKAPTGPQVHIPAREAFIKLFTEAGRLELGADAANGQGSAAAKLVRFLERNNNLNLPPELFNALVTAEGPAAYAAQIASDAFAKARNFVTTPVIDTAVEDFLKGDITVIDLRRYLGPSKEAQEFGNFIVTGRESIALLQKMFVSGLPEGDFKKKILKSLDKGNYLTRMYRIFHDPDYKPTQDQIEAVAQKLMVTNPKYDISTARSIVEDYLHQIETQRQMYSGAVTDVGQKLDSIIFQKRNDALDIAFRDMIGEYTNPKEQVMGTIRHLYTSAIASKFYDNIAGLTDKLGLKMAYGRDEVSAIKESLQVAITKAKAAGKDFATLQKQLNVLQGYVPLDSSVKYGKLKGQMVSRFVRDQLASFDSPWGLLDGSIMRGLASAHNYIKIGRTALNPITVVRNIVSAPILMALGRADPRYTGRAFKAMRNRLSADFRELLEQGIYGVDQVRGEFLRSTEQILMGDYDHHTLEGVFKTGLNSVLEFYRAPDMIVRGTTYFSAKARFAKKFGLPQTDKRVIDAARDWTNRYTVNYANVAPMIKTLRQVPFTNLFISYTAEVTRIAKNLISDIFEHEDVGQRVFAAGAIGGLISIGPLMEMASVNALSDKDKKEWERAVKQMPEYARTRFKVITSKEGSRFKYLDITPLLQIDAIEQMFRAAGNQDWRAFAAVNPVFGWENTPIMNVVAEQITGRDLRRDRPIDQNILTRAQAVMKEIIPPAMPGGYEYKRLTDAFTLNEKGERGITQLRSGKRTVPSEIVSSYLTGMKLTTVDSSNLARFAVSDAKRKIANEASYLRDVTGTDLPQIVKERAKQRYDKAVKAILLDLQASMSVEE